MFSERNGSPSSITKVEAKEYVCIKTSVTQIKTSANLGGTSKYQAAYNKSSYPRSIFNKNVGNFWTEKRSMEVASKIILLTER